MHCGSIQLFHSQPNHWAYKRLATSCKNLKCLHKNVPNTNVLCFITDKCINVALYFSIVRNKTFIKRLTFVRYQQLNFRWCLTVHCAETCHFYKEEMTKLESPTEMGFVPLRNFDDDVQLTDTWKVDVGLTQWDIDCYVVTLKSTSLIFVLV